MEDYYAEGEAAFGQNIIELPKLSDHRISLLKTVRNLLMPGWSLSYMTFPVSGMMRNGRLYKQIGLDLGIKESEFSLLPTPCKSDPRKGLMVSLEAYQKYFSKPKYQDKLIYQCYLNGLTGIQTNEVSEQIQGFPKDWTKMRSRQLEIALT